MIIQNFGWTYSDGRLAKQSLRNLWNLDTNTYGQHVRPSTNGGHGVVTGNPQKIFVNGMEIPIVEVTGISLDKSELNLTAGGDPGSLMHTLSPTDATVKELIWSIDKPEVARITEVSGLANKIIEPLSNGTATITVTSVDGAFSAKTMVYVGTVAKPSLSIAGGTYDSAQTVTINTTTAGAGIRYTTDGSIPTATNGTAISSGGTVAISSTTTLKTIAYKSGLQDSEVAEGTYTVNGSLKVNIGPSGLVPGAQWQVDGGAWQNTGTMFTGLSAGNHTVSFKDIASWYPPNAKTVLINSGELTTISANYSQTPPTSSLRVTITPADVVTAGAQWRVDGGTWQNSGTTLTGLSIGSKTIDFNDIRGWTKPASQTMTIIQDELSTTQADYAPILYTQAQLDQEVTAATTSKDQVIAQKDQTIANLNSTVTERNQTIAAMFTKTQLDKAVADANAAKDLVISEKDQTIAAMFTKTQLDKAVADANAAKDLVISEKDQTIAAMFTKTQLDKAVADANDSKDLVIAEKDQTIASMFTKTQLDKAVADANAAKDLVIAEKDQTIASMFTKIQLDKAVADANAAKDLVITEKDQTIASMFTKTQLDKAVADEKLKYDINGDEKIDMAEVIYILQTMTNVR